MLKPKNLLKGDWESLLRHVLILVDDIAKHGVPDPFWTFGGGTVLMLRYQHRLSKDVDIFVQQIERRAPLLKVQFDAINTLTYGVSYEVAAQKATQFLQSL